MRVDSPHMTKTRLEAFSDGVIAIIITIMVLEIRPPHGVHLADLAPIGPSALAYLLSFIYIGIYWNNHHHMFHAVDHITGGVMWANLHLLFWLSLVPFSTAWMGENGNAALPTAVYGATLFGCAIAYSIVIRALLHNRGANPRLAAAIGSDRKGNISLFFYIAAIPLAFVNQLIADALYVSVALIWLVPDKRIEHLPQRGGA
jgi:uncharacterized membrane protein